MEHTANQAAIRGNPAGAAPVFPMKITAAGFTVSFWRSRGCPSRGSPAGDCPGGALNQMDLSGGSYVEVRGQVRSFNNHSLCGAAAADFRLCRLRPNQSGGALQPGPSHRDHLQGSHLPPDPLGREICDVMLAVPRSYRRSDYLPCILWGRTAQAISQCATGDTISLTGRLQSRLYRKATGDGVEVRTAYEISALTAQCHQDTAT